MIKADLQCRGVRTYVFSQIRLYQPLGFAKTICFCNKGDTIQYLSGLGSRELGQAPMLLVFLSPRQALIQSKSIRPVSSYATLCGGASIRTASRHAIHLAYTARRFKCTK